MKGGLRLISINGCIGALIAFAFGIISCSSGGHGTGNSGNKDNGDNSGTGIMGCLAENLRKPASSTSGLHTRQFSAALISKAAEAGAIIDRICGMPIVRRLDTVPGSRLVDMYCVDVNADGTFTIPVGNKDEDWVYVLIDSALPKEYQVVGFVGLQDIEATGAMMLSWPADAQSKNVDVGTVSADTGETLPLRRPWRTTSRHFLSLSISSTRSPKTDN